MLFFAGLQQCIDPCELNQPDTALESRADLVCIILKSFQRGDCALELNRLATNQANAGAASDATVGDLDVAVEGGRTGSVDDPGISNDRKTETLPSAGVGLIANVTRHAHAEIYWGYGFNRGVITQHHNLQDYGVHFAVNINAF